MSFKRPKDSDLIEVNSNVPEDAKNIFRYFLNNRTSGACVHYMRSDIKIDNMKVVGYNLETVRNTINDLRSLYVEPRHKKGTKPPEVKEIISKKITTPGGKELEVKLVAVQDITEVLSSDRLKDVILGVRVKLVVKGEGIFIENTSSIIDVNLLDMHEYLDGGYSDLPQSVLDEIRELNETKVPSDLDMTNIKEYVKFLLKDIIKDRQFCQFNYWLMAKLFTDAKDEDYALVFDEIIIEGDWDTSDEEYNSITCILPTVKFHIAYEDKTHYPEMTLCNEKIPMKLSFNKNEDTIIVSKDVESVMSAHSQIKLNGRRKKDVNILTDNQVTFECKKGIFVPVQNSSKYSHVLIGKSFMVHEMYDYDRSGFLNKITRVSTPFPIDPEKTYDVVYLYPTRNKVSFLSRLFSRFL